MTKISRSKPHGSLQRGDRVRIKSATEILSSLDENGRLEGLPFMPEALRWCGETVEVRARADKTCDTISDTWGMRRLTGTVHLEDLRCDGSAHGGCQAGCLLFWKEEWLEAPSAEPDARKPSRARLSALEATTSQGDRYFCQATELINASAPLPWRMAGQYVQDLRAGNVGLLGLFRILALFLVNKYQSLSKRVLPRRLRINAGQWFPHITGESTSTPIETLDLRPGELVEVKSHEEILATLNKGARNRGLLFDSEMLPYCGRRFRVLRRVEKIIDERTGRMLSLPRDCIILSGVTCKAVYHRYCPRAIYPYWREIWLRRVSS